MVNKIIAWVVVGITFVIWSFAFDYIDGLSDESGLMPAMILMVITAYIMLRSDTPEGDMMTTIIDSMKGFMMSVVFVTVAVLVYDVIMMGIGGAFDVMGLVNTAIFSVVSLVTSALVFSAVGAAHKA